MLKWLMLLLYFLFISYILWRSVHVIKNTAKILNKKLIFAIYIVLFSGLCLTLILGGLLPESELKILLHKFSNFWLGFFIYFLFFILIVDIIVIILKQINKKREIKFLKSPEGYRCVAIIVIALSIGFTVYGNIHAKKIYTNTYDVTVEKKAGNLSDLNIVLISDLHLGYSIGCEIMEDMVSKINSLNADIVVVAGDIVDNEYEALEDPDRLAKILSGIKSKYGTYAVYGNHDVAETLIGGFSITDKSHAFRDSRVVTFLEKCNFKMIEDSSVLIDNSFYLIGRLDGEKAGDGTANRKSIHELTKGLDSSKPFILLAHEPDELKENAEAGIDINLNGHTHAGQFFPLTIAQPIAWKNYWGYMKVDNMHDYVSSGIGVYGPNLRVATDSEIMQIKVHFNK